MNWFLIQCMVIVIYLTCHLVRCTPIVRDVRLTLENVASGYSNYEHAGPGTYAFGYDIDDLETQNTQFRDEERHPNGTVTGSYGWVDLNGNVYMVRYIADERGYRAKLENMPNFKNYGRRFSNALHNSLKP